MADPELENFPGFSYDPLRFDTIIGEVDPFIGTPRQTNRMRANIRITVAGVDVTAKLEPRLISMTVKIGDPSDECDLELDDRDGTLPIPPIQSLLTAEIGWTSESMAGVFIGYIADVEHGFGRKQGGRRMWVHADGVDLLSKVKEPIQDHMGEGAPPGKKEGDMHGLGAWTQQFLKHAGITANLGPGVEKFKQDFWSAANESPMHLVNSLSQQFGLMHRFHSGNLVDIITIGDVNTTSVQAIWNQNLISWRVKPFTARSAFGGSKQQHYDPQGAAWKMLKQGFGLEGIFGQATADTQSQTPAGSESAAGQDNEGAQGAADASNMGNGRIIINGEPTARWGTFCLLQGTRPGVDGSYLINQVVHVYSRAGFVTTLNVEPRANAPLEQNVRRGFLPRPALNVG